MGRMLIAEVRGRVGCRLAGGIEAPGGAAIGRDLGELAGGGSMGLAVGSDAAALFVASDVIIDFTTPEASINHARLAASLGKPLVIGTTGFDSRQHQLLAEAATQTPLLWSANMSPAVTLLTMLVEEATKRLGPDYDIEVLEMHHRHKVDAPSGTALALGRAAAGVLGVDLDAVSERVRDGRPGARRQGAIGFASLRGGDVVGDHSVIFAGPFDRLELTHRAANRQLFAAGAVRAAWWLARQPPGL